MVVIDTIDVAIDGRYRLKFRRTVYAIHQLSCWLSVKHGNNLETIPKFFTHVFLNPVVFDIVDEISNYIFIVDSVKISWDHVVEVIKAAAAFSPYALPRV